jgi:sigma-B regulation protein RsbU (phosphoserine phosphatase)
MGFRWKLLALLVVIAVLPITAMRTLGVNNVRGFSQEMIARSRAYLIAQNESRLKLLVESYAQNLEHGRAQLEMALMFQAKEIELALGSEPPRAAALSAGAMGAPAAGKPPGVEPSSLEVFGPAPGFAPPAARGPNDPAARIQRLMSLGEFHRGLGQLLGEQVLWHITVFGDGLFSLYPRRGGVPEGFDPRREPWYLEEFVAGSQWSKQYVDPLSGQEVIALSAPVRDADGTRTAVTALVVPIDRFFERLMSLDIPPDAQCIVGTLAPRPDTGREGVRILVQERHGPAADRRLGLPATTEWLNGEEAEGFKDVIADLKQGRGSTRRLNYNDCDCLWVYRPIPPDAHLMLIMPFSAIMETAEKAEAAIEAEIERLLGVTRVGIIAILAAVVALAFAFARSVTRPLHILAEGARRLAEGDFNARVDIRSRDEFGQMGKVFNLMGPRLDENFRLRRSMDLAKEVQQSLLPKSEPRIEGLDVAGRSIYCEETGGDYYDYLTFEEAPGGRTGFVVADVSGHGLSSALLMTSVRSLLRQRAAMPGGPRQIVADVNRQLTRDNADSGQFVTLFYAEADLRGMRLSWVRAGHEPALLFDAATGRFAELSGAGMAIGVSPEAQFEERARPLAPGQIIVLGTDGIWETRDPQGRMYGRPALRQVIRDNAGKSARELVEAVIGAVERFRGPGAKSEDDITLVVAKVL